jgi:triacylglycerol lipase
MALNRNLAAHKSPGLPVKALVSLCMSAALFVSATASAGFLDFLLPKKDEYTKTRYPIVLSHGLFGFGNIAGLDYWYGIPGELKRGGADVLISEVSVENSNEVRGEQLIDHLEEWAALKGYTKFNLIGHSQGGGDVRYVAGTRPDLVASVTTVGASHKGSGVADAIDLVPNIPGLRESIASVVEVVGYAIHFISGNNPIPPQDALGALGSLTTAGAADFNRRFPLGIPTSACGEGAYQANGMRFYSWTGSYTLTSLDPNDGGMVTGAAVNRIMGKGDSDGLAPVCGAHFGKVIRDDYIMNHLDEVNQILGLVSPFETNPKDLYRHHANRLKLAGL